MDINNKRIILYLGSLLFVAYIFSIFIFASFINNMFDEKYENRNFKFGEICYLGYEARSGKSANTYKSTSIYYFSIDGLKSTDSMRPYFPFKDQFPIFIKNMDRNKCYKAKYIEVKILFYEQRRIYELLDFDS